jgi:hypothetical protein
MKIRFTGYKYWKMCKEDLGFSRFFILPCINVEVDRNFNVDEYPTEITFGWLFWSIRIYLEK